MTQIAPLIVPFNAIPQRTLTNVLSTIPDQRGGNFFVTEQINRLINFKLNDGSNMFDLTPDARDFTNQMVFQIRTYGYDVIYNFLTSRSWSNRNDIILESPAFESSKQKVKNDDEVFRNKTEVEKGDIKCNRCGGNEVLIAQAQTRSADEPMSLLIKCLTCGTNWTG